MINNQEGFTARPRSRETERTRIHGPLLPMRGTDTNIPWRTIGLAVALGILVLALI